MNEPTTVLPNNSNQVDALPSQFARASEKQQKQMIPELIELGESGWDVLMEFLPTDRGSAVTLVQGMVYQALYAAKTPKTQEFLISNFPTGLVPLVSDRGLDYSDLQQLLAEQDFQQADRLTLQKLCQLAGSEAIQRKWLYFTEIDNIPASDLQTINSLWFLHSQGKFGFSVQRELWLGGGKNWEKLWSKIGWKQGNNWTRYPQEFIWDLSAPTGHLPLSNQLRGVRVIAALFSHPAWSK
ncbi:GUN4 domain-containing protein [Merismopedia glauca]|uniref:GUN4 domain-containing protein n=1 Tax=Merismopedia glauca CCAP 1448/3 TaxID=1296344 RepID=A0A2T1C1E9_9CYAN|nr:GUN4 domain-containing protein [Merismopedia glauca]PSB01953.1 hypothetical protein C7B64_15730 [Merismopedia glauca CCAP 1448/3]